MRGSKISGGEKNIWTDIQTDQGTRLLEFHMYMELKIKIKTPETVLTFVPR